MAETADPEQADTYDDAAAAIDWKGPSLVFQLMAEWIRPGQTILDIGIGTGLGSEPFFQAGLHVHGMDISSSMMDICRRKGIAEHLTSHDLTQIPYPFDEGSFDNVISTGVFHFFPDLDRIFGEIARIIADGGRFAFVTGDRAPDEPCEIIAAPEQTGTGKPVTMHRPTPEHVIGWLEKNGFRPAGSVPFSVWMDKEHTKKMPMRAHLAEMRRIRPPVSGK